MLQGFYALYINPLLFKSFCGESFKQITLRREDAKTQRVFRIVLYYFNVV